MRVVITGLDGVTFERGIDDGVWAPDGKGPVLDLSAFTAVPGLVDAHSHLSGDDMVEMGPGRPAEIERRAFAAVDRGVFLVLDKGWRDAAVLSLRDAPPARTPHFEAAGRIIAADDGYFAAFAIETDDAGLADAVRRTLPETAGWVKIIGDWPRRGRGPVTNFGEEALRAAVGVAHAAGAKVAVHTMADEAPSMAVRAGVDSIEHGLFLTDRDVRALGSRGGHWVPTVLQMEAVRDRFGPERTAGRIVSAGLERMRELLPTAREHGVRVLAGTDLAVPSSAVAEEAIRLVAHGLTPTDALAAVSSDGWASSSIGVPFEVGSPADLVAFRSDPREDITILRSPAAVIRAGTVHRPPG